MLEELSLELSRNENEVLYLNSVISHLNLPSSCPRSHVGPGGVRNEMQTGGPKYLHRARIHYEHIV